jgi:hypothetical protein
MLIYKNARYYRVAKLPGIMEEQNTVQKEIDTQKEDKTAPEAKPEGAEVAPDTGTDWRQHTDAIMSALREQLGAPGEENRGKLRLLGVEMKNVFGTPEFGYELHGNFETELDVDAEQYGKPPYNFVAHIDPEDKLILPVEITVA